MLANRISRITIAGALTIAGAAGIQLANPGTASARCVGVRNPTTTDLRAGDSGTRIAWETPVTDTCNDNGDYQTTLSAISGWTPYLFSQNGGEWTLRKVGAGLVSWGAASHQSGEILCAMHDGSGNSWCGTGTNVVLGENGVLNIDPSTSLLNYGF